MRTIPPIGGLLLSTLAGIAMAQDEGLPRTKAPQGAEAYFISPSNGETLSSPVTVRFGLRGMGVAPAGATNPNTGHHHLLIDLEQLPPDHLPLPATDQVRHFGGGQTETVLELPPGTHRLQLTLGDALHIPHDPPVRSEAITITIVAP